MRKSLWAVAVCLAVFAFAGDSFAGNYWDNWTKGKAQGPMPDCGVNVLPLGGDQILQDTVDIYCGVKPGSYKSWINPKVMKIYKRKGKHYPDGKTGVLVFKTIGVVFTTDHKDGQPIYDVLTIADEKSVASSEPNHPLNPNTCKVCHETHGGTCKGFVCGNRLL
ncbi:hypothetical protein MNBD_NITROSPINAE01-1897 [hydrothermal vent metagenome]|uniref:Uncharacterized protein n=1 Tax=hydrothermal vent metagenome TaxID=652676 RepID=A0A3B1CLL6_9ZZZZ